MKKEREHDVQERQEQSRSKVEIQHLPPVPEHHERNDIIIKIILYNNNRKIHIKIRAKIFEK